MVKFTDGALHHSFGVLDLGQIGFHGNNPATVLLQYRYLLMPDGTSRTMTADERADTSVVRHQ